MQRLILLLQNVKIQPRQSDLSVEDLLLGIITSEGMPHL
jgi:hypothetical protein